MVWHQLLRVSEHLVAEQWKTPQVVVFRTKAKLVGRFSPLSHIDCVWRQLAGANNFVPVFVSVTSADELLSSVFSSQEDSLFPSCASALPSNQLLKSSNVAQCQYSHGMHLLSLMIASVSLGLLVMPWLNPDSSVVVKGFHSRQRKSGKNWSDFLCFAFLMAEFCWVCWSKYSLQPVLARFSILVSSVFLWT